eukprot:366301-Chlamydomonas_euryale.AAC.34
MHSPRRHHHCHRRHLPCCADRRLRGSRESRGSLLAFAVTGFGAGRRGRWKRTLVGSHRCRHDEGQERRVDLTRWAMTRRSARSKRQERSRRIHSVREMSK